MPGTVQCVISPGAETHAIKSEGKSNANLFDLSGRVAVVTGGNGVTGRVIALGLARAGAVYHFVHRHRRLPRR